MHDADPDAIQFHGLAQQAEKAGDYVRAEIFYRRAAKYAVTDDGRNVLIEKAVAAAARARRDE